MGGFVTSRSVANRHDVYAEERKPPAVIQATGTGVVGLVGQFPWGPDTEVIKPGSVAERNNTIAPAGMSRIGQGYLATIQKGFPLLYLARVLGSAAAKSAVTLDDSAVDTVTVTAKYKGAAGNSIDVSITDATDGDPNHFNMRVFVTSESGLTEDIFQNLNYSGVGDDSIPDLSQALLVGAIAMVAAGRPDNGDFNMIGGSDGTINGARYIGTAGEGNFGMALFENDKSIRTVFADDPGDTDRDAVNNALLAHCDLMGDRIAIINGNAGLSLSAAQASAANYRSAKAVYVDPWVYIYDDTDGTQRLVPSASFGAAVISQTSPSSSPAMKDEARIAMLRGIVSLETSRGAGAGSNTTQGLMTIIHEENGGFTFEAGVLTIAPSDPAKRNITRTRTGQYIASSVTTSLRSSVDQPNVPLLQQDLVNAVDNFMIGMKRAQNTDPVNTPHVKDYYIAPIGSVNTQAQIDAGDFTIPLDAKTSSAMERIFLSIQYGETVQITAS